MAMGTVRRRACGWVLQAAHQATRATQLGVYRSFEGNTQLECSPGRKGGSITHFVVWLVSVRLLRSVAMAGNSSPLPALRSMYTDQTIHWRNCFCHCQGNLKRPASRIELVKTRILQRSCVGHSEVHWQMFGDQPQKRGRRRRKHHTTQGLGQHRLAPRVLGRASKCPDPDLREKQGTICLTQRVRRDIAISCCIHRVTKMQNMRSIPSAHDVLEHAYDIYSISANRYRLYSRRGSIVY